MCVRLTLNQNVYSFCCRVSWLYMASKRVAKILETAIDIMEDVISFMLGLVYSISLTQVCARVCARV